MSEMSNPLLDLPCQYIQPAWDLLRNRFSHLNDFVTLLAPFHQSLLDIGLVWSEHSEPCTY